MSTTWTVDRVIATEHAAAVAWLQRLAARFDTARLDAVTLSVGRGGRSYSGYCRYPASGRGYRLSVSLPGPWPRLVRFYSKFHAVPPEGLTAPAGWRRGRSSVVHRKGETCLLQSFERELSLSRDDALIYIGAHEIFHWLRHSRQIPGANVEWQAQAWGLARLDDYRKEHSDATHMEG